MAFSWQNHIAKLEKKQLYRAERLAKSGNTDFKMRYPNLVREIETGNTRSETKQMIKKNIEIHVKYGHVPKPSVLIKRMNRVV